jgi:rod shape-determining protein MreC
VSILMLVTDLRFHTLEWVRLAVATAGWPLQRVAYLPVEAGGDLGKYFSSLVTLHNENDDLRRKQVAIANLLLRQQHLEDENKHLRALLDMRARQPVEGRVADILYATRDPFSRRVVIDKGTQQGIAAGAAVIDDIGVIGQVTRVFPLSAEVTLLTDKEQAIPVEVQRNGLRAILAGAGGGMMELRYMAANAEVQPGDVLVTSGLDGIYLPGLPAARVTHVDHDSSFARIQCAPIAGVERHGQVLVLGNREILPPPPESAVAAEDKSGKVRRLKKGH